MKLNKIILLLFLTNSLFAADSANKDSAIFAMGCFWCAESEYNGVAGVLDVTVGYAGGTVLNPTYKNHPGYKEAIRVDFDPSKVSYSKLLDIFWHNVDPFDAKGQFCDKGFSYTAVIYYQNNEQKMLAEQSKVKIETYFKQKEGASPNIAVEILPFTSYYLAEGYHQDYKQKNPVSYRFYRWNCGRDARLAEVWGQ